MVLTLQRTRAKKIISEINLMQDAKKLKTTARD